MSRAAASVPPCQGRAARLHAAEIEPVVIHAAAIVADGGALLGREIIQMGQQIFQGFALELRTVGQGGVQIVHIGLKVLVVVKMQGVFPNGGNQGVVSIGKRGRE